MKLHGKTLFTSFLVFEQRSVGKSEFFTRPIVPIGNGDCPNVTPLSDGINDGPVLLATLEMVEDKVGQSTLRTH
jgi:hypothetical protein